jgi:glyoxylase-like metal-dependent hydrolase (beta-lactamase superfamily II)
MVTKPIRHILPVAAALFAAAACGDSQPEATPSSTPPAAAPAATPAAPAADVVRTGDPAARGYTDADFPRVQEIAPGVYTYEALRSFDGVRVATVSFFVVTDQGVLVADGQGSPAETQALIDRIAQVTTQPITTVVNGSHHPDHSGGNAAFPATAVVLAHPTSAAALQQQGATPQRIETVTDSRTLTMGGREIRVLHLGRAHTGGDLVVQLPAEGVVFMGETFQNRVFPSLGSSFPREWIAVIERAQALGATTYIPGHGFVDPPAVMAEELANFRGLIARVLEEVQHVYAEGAAVEEAFGRANFGDFAAWTRAEQLRETAIRRAYADLSGELLAN